MEAALKPLRQYPLHQSCSRFQSLF